MNGQTVERRDSVLTCTGCPGVDELRHALCDVLGSGGHLPALVSEQRIKPRVYRLVFSVKERTRSLFIKRMDPDVARRNSLVAKRWLPAVGMAEHGPPLLGVAAEPGGMSVWHIYDDLGDWALDRRAGDATAIERAVEVIARLHTSFFEHRLLGECRLWGGSFGAEFYASNLRDALYALAALRSTSIRLTDEQAEVRSRLGARLRALLDEEAERTRVMNDEGGPETLLHGDLWTTNTLVSPATSGRFVRLIDWDHAGVGPVSYDLSTFMLQFPGSARNGILAMYREHVARAGCAVPSPATLNTLFTTAEFARLANRVIWPAIAVLDGQTEWGFAELARVEQWFGALTPAIMSA